jgi:hypothetical protein
VGDGDVQWNGNCFGESYQEGTASRLAIGLSYQLRTGQRVGMGYGMLWSFLFVPLVFLLRPETVILWVALVCIMLWNFPFFL